MMVHCYKHVIESTEVVRRLVGGSSDTSFQLNEGQCQILANELVETNAFLEKRSVSSKFGEGVESISLRHLCSAVQRAEVLIKKCCCKDLESWLVSAMMLVEIQEEFMAIILDIHLWRMLLDFAITCGSGLSWEKKVEEMKIMDEQYHQLFKDLRRESHALRQAAVEDKGTTILRTSRIANIRGSTSDLDYLRAIYMQSWLSGNAACRDMDLNKCDYGHLLGQGGCGAVMKVKWLGVECALKMLGGQDEKEATVLKGLFHPNIIRLFHYWEDHPENPQSRLLMELMPQDLGAYMRGLSKGVSSSKMPNGKNSVPFSLPVAIDIMYQIAQAMRYMHDKHLTHRDLKPANILVKERSQMGLPCIDGLGYLDIKLADFGLVKSYTNTSTFQAPSRNKGTGMYRAPELFGQDMTQKRHYSQMVDVWSFGITCAEILSGKPAYAEYVDDYGLAIQSMICKKGLRPTLPKHCPEYLAFCIKSCWEFLPSRRPTFASICKMLRHAHLLSLGVTKLDDSKFFFAYRTQSHQMQSLELSPLSSSARVSTWFQSSLKFMGIGPRRVPSVAEAAIMPEVRLVPTPMISEDSSELNENIGGGIATPGSLSDVERHYPAVFPVADVLHKEQVVSSPMVTEKSPVADEDVAGSIATLANPTQVVKSLPGLQEPVQLTQARLGNVISPPAASDPIQPAIIPPKEFGTIYLTRKADGRNVANICLMGEEGELFLSANRQRTRPLSSFQAATPRAPTDRDLQAALHESSTGVQQSGHGLYDLAHYYLKGKQAGESPFSADYVGPVIVTDVGRGRGRGLVLTKDVEAGELLLVSNPMAFLALQDVDQTRRDISQAFVDGKVQEGFRHVFETAHHKGLEKLPTLCDGEKSLPAPSVHQTGAESGEHELHLDHARVRRIIQLNAINGDATMGWENLPGSGEQDKKVEHWGLWWLPSFINHSCLPSSSPILVGKALFLFAARDLRAGEEVTRAYFDIFQPLDQRKELSAKGWGFVCYCPRCKLEDALHSSLSKVTEQYTKLMELASKSKSEFGTDERLSDTQTSAALKFFHKLETKLKDFKLNAAENNWVRSSFLHYIDMISGDHELHTHLESIVEALVTVCPGSETTLHMAVVAKDSARRTFGKKSTQFKAGNHRALNICRFTYGKQKASVHS